MELTFTLVILLVAELVVLALVAAAGGLAAVFGCRFRRFFLNGLWALLVPPSGMLYGALVERDWYRIKEVEIVSDRLPCSFDGYRIVQISDVHLLSFRNRAHSLAKAVELVNGLEPDAVAFTGDMVSYSPSEMEGLEDILATVKAKDGVYSVLGNHDYCIYRHWPDEPTRLAAVAEVVERQRAMGWNVLMNENVNIVRASCEAGPSIDGASSCAAVDTISIVGVENMSCSKYFPSYGSLGKAMDGASGDYKILLSHDPNHWSEEVSCNDDIDLMLAGHTHAMQLKVFGWSPSRFLFSEYAGLYGGPSRRDDGRSGNFLYVNIGLGETALPARVGARPEITLITLRSR